MDMKEKTLLILGLSIVVLCAGCSKDSHPEEKPVDMVDFVGKLTNWDWSEIEANRLYVIRSMDEYTRYVKSENDPLPEIDFEKYSLLVAKGQANRGVAGMDNKVISSGSESYLLDINITLNAATAMDEWYVGILASVPRDKKIEMKVGYHP